MKTLLLTGGIATLIAFSACSGNDTPAYDNSLPSTNDTTTQAAAIPTVDSGAQNITTAAPVLNNNPVQVQPQQAAPVITNTTSKTAAGTNPPHGQPGHRCDIAVGAPLNSAPTAGTQAPVVTQATPMTATPTQAKPSVISGAKPAVNPPHGQPGHDCAVQVGAPLPQ